MRLALRARARGGLSATAPLTLRRRSRAPGRPSRGLAGRYFWRTVTRSDYAWGQPRRRVRRRRLGLKGFSGYCGLITGCSTWTHHLTLRPDGRFALSSMTLASMGGGGAPFTAAWNAPPDQHGTYEVLTRGRIRLSFADGTVSVRTIGIEQPAAKGLLLDDTNFYPDSD